MPIYEKVEHLIPGETYRVKHYDRDLGYVRFERYEGIPMSTITIRLFTENHSFSRQITEEEYRAKVKEKYDKNALQTVLKGLIDECF